MIDKLNFTRFDPNYRLPTPRNTLHKREGTDLLTKEELLLASPIVYGYSLTDRMWGEYLHASPSL